MFSWGEDWFTDDVVSSYSKETTDFLSFCPWWSLSRNTISIRDAKRWLPLSAIPSSFISCNTSIKGNLLHGNPSYIGSYIGLPWNKTRQILYYFTLLNNFQVRDQNGLVFFFFSPSSIINLVHAQADPTWGDLLIRLVNADSYIVVWWGNMIFQVISYTSGQGMLPALSVNKGCCCHQAISLSHRIQVSTVTQFKMEKSRTLALDS